MSKILGASLTIFSEVLNRKTKNRRTHFEKISDLASLEKFQLMFEEKEKVKLPLDYLCRGDVYFCRNHEGKIVGGFAVILSGPFRSLEQVPGKIRLPTKIRLEEVNGVWLDSTSCVHRRIRFWTYLLGSLLLAPGNAIVYAVDAKKSALRETLFNRIREFTLFEGFVNNLEGMIADGQSLEAVEISMKSKLSTESMRYLFTYCSDLAKHSFKSMAQPNAKLSFTMHNKTRRFSSRRTAIHASKLSSAVNPSLN